MHVAITGASSGIGEAVAREFARAGADITLVARRRDLLERIAAELGTRTFVATQDLSDHAHAADWVDPAEAELGPIDVLISNAGFLTMGEVATFDAEEGQRMIAVNLCSPTRLMQTLVPRMVARKSGVVVNVTSVAAFVSIPGWAYQAASKTASAVFSETLRGELAGTGVHVLTVYPGLTDTPMAQGGLDTYGRKGLASMIPLGSADELAGRLRRAVERRRTRLIYPRYYAVVRWFPRISAWFTSVFAPRVPAQRSP